VFHATLPGGDREAMALVVQKFGGTSVGDPERIKNVARKALAQQARGDQVVVVVSAMSGETDRLLKLVKAITPRPSPRESDAVAATGEQVTIGLTALAIEAAGGKARSFTGSQVRILTDSAFTKARILAIDEERLRRSLAAGEIPVVAGFQGCDEDGNITTLGRGGSDTTAVALAAALKADACDIYTDVDGVYTTDPNVCRRARKLDRITYEEMLELASLGAKVLQIRSVEFAMKYKVPLWVKTSFSDAPGTLVCAEDQHMEQPIVSGIAYARDEAKLAVRHLPDHPGVASALFEPLAAANIVVDVIVQNVSTDGFTDLTFTVPRGDLARAQEVVEATARRLGATGVDADASIAKVSIVGVGMRSHAGVAAKFFKVLASENVNVQMISTSEIKVSAIIEEKYVELAVRSLHTAFGLDAPEAK
jgi:aspartate kinase